MAKTHRTCPVCSGPVVGRSDKVHCSPECKRVHKHQYDIARYDEIRHLKIANACEWQRKNRERKQAYDAAYRERTSERRLAAKREWQREKTARRDPRDLAANRLSSRARDARLKTEARIVTVKDITRTRTRQRDECAYCMTALAGGGEVEHVLPIVRGGRHAIGNIVLACKDCNRSKAHRTVMEWRMRKPVARKSIPGFLALTA